MASPTRMLMTPRKPWSFFLNFFWSKTCTARMLSSLALLLAVSGTVQHAALGAARGVVRRLQVERLIPIRIQCPLRNPRRLGLLAIDGGNREGVGKPYERKGQHHATTTGRRTRGAITY